MATDDRARTEHRATALPATQQIKGAPTDPLAELSALSPAGLEHMDIARLNLIAAVGLPGSEDLDIEATLATLDRWAAHVKRETERHLYQFQLAPQEFEHSEAYFRVLMLITVLQQDLGVKYNPDRIADVDFTNSKDLFIHGMTPGTGETLATTKGGTCVSMPVLTVAVGRRLGYPLKLAVTKGHVFARWDAPDHPDALYRDRFNVECASRGLHTYDDEHYANWPYTLSEDEINAGWFLRSLTAAEVLGVFVMSRGHCLEDNGRIDEAAETYRLAAQLAPQSDAQAFLAGLRRRSAPQRSRFNHLDSLNEHRASRRRGNSSRVDEILHQQREGMRQLTQPPMPNRPNSGSQ